MTTKLTGLILLLLLAACDINQPKAPRLEGQWQCRNGITITFKDQQHYTATSSAGESAGVYKLTVGENNYHGIEWNAGVKDAEAPLPSRFRYFETDRLVRLFFYTHNVDEAVPCERGR
ncbi:MAG: hypothetical protein K8H84_14030 [Sulfuricella denitrificans]|nr:hypothetical protein [Sulfuricella denitrificans]